MYDYPPAVNFHFWRPCNMGCRFCFARFEDVPAKLLLKRSELLQVTKLLARAFDKVNFVGGEPTLCPHLLDLLEEAKRCGATTGIVTNGTRLDRAAIARLAPYLDWIGLSLDSVDPDTLRASGRALKRDGSVLSEQRLRMIADAVHQNGIRLKINIVVHRLNAEQNLVSLLCDLRPERVKFFQMLPIRGQNDAGATAFAIDRATFGRFVERHREPLERAGATVVAEDNDAMTGSYAMVDPAARFFDNTNGHHNYSAPILEVGLEAAWRQIRFDRQRFEARGGLYAWRALPMARLAGRKSI